MCRHCPYGQQQVPAAKRTADALPSRPLRLRPGKRPPLLKPGEPARPLPPWRTGVLWTQPGEEVREPVLGEEPPLPVLLFAPSGQLCGSQLHLHAAFDALKAAGLEAVVVPLAAAPDAAALMRVLHELRVDGAGVAGALQTRGVLL